MKQQVFVVQPNEDGMYEIAKWNEQKDQYIPLRGEKYLTFEDAKSRERELNKEHQEQP